MPAGWPCTTREATPTFSVGEYDWDKHGDQRGWIWHSATTPDDLKTASAVFDFSTFFALKDNKGKHAHWYGLGNGLGMNGRQHRRLSVEATVRHLFGGTMITGYRTNRRWDPPRTPQE